MALPTQLNATEQDTLVKQIGLSLLRAAPRDWRQVVAEYRAVGRYHELTGHVVTADGETHDWVATHDITTLFGRLRAGMFREGRGTWFNARYQLDHPSSYNLEYDREEPEWDLAPPPQAYSDELRMFPRSEENTPEWLLRRMSGLGPEQPGPRFRMARIFDGAGQNGKPLINRPEIGNDEHDWILDYLDGAPVVAPGRGYDIDRLAPVPESTVPIAFHSDGVWIWPAAVNYYLREYGVAPEPGLVEHIRANDFRIPDVPDTVRQAAAAHLNRGGAPARRPENAVPDPEPKQAPEPPPTVQQAPAAPVAEGPPPDRAEPVARFDETDAERTALAAPIAFDESTRLNQPVEQGGQGLFEERAEYEERVEHGGDAEVEERAEQPEPAARAAHAEEPELAGAATPEDAAVPDDREPRQPDLDERARPGEPDEDALDEHDEFGWQDEYRGHGSGRPGELDRTGELDQLEETGELRPREEFDPAEPESPGGGRHAEADDGSPEQATTFTPLAGIDAGSATSITAPQPATVNKHATPEAPAGDPGMEEAPTAEQDTAEQPLPRHDQVEPGDSGPPTQYNAPPKRFEAPVLTDLQRRLDELGVPDAAYAIGEPTERGWSLEEVPDGWRVGWYDGELQSPEVFAEPEDAAAFLLGKVLLSESGAGARAAAPGRRPEPRAAPAPPAGAPPMSEHAPPLPARSPVPAGPAPAPPSRRPVAAALAPETGAGGRPPGPPREEPGPAGRRAAAGPPPREATPAPPRREGRPPAERPEGRPQGGQQAGQPWPIQPMQGEPPLTLFRGKEIRELPVGSELDRFGGPNGNLTYAAGTPFEQRSLVPEWVSRPYHVYRVQRPLEALAGVAIPWFDQPGGGAAYLLPASVDELVADGDLIELEPGEPPVD